MKSTDELIAKLSRDLAPVSSVTGITTKALLWLLASAALSILAIHLYGPLRPGALQQLLNHPRFLLEILFGAATIVVLTLAGFRSAIPGMSSRRLGWIGLAMLSLWLISYGIGLASPAMEPSMLGKRDHCIYEVLLLGTPTALFGTYLCTRWYPLEPVELGWRCGVAAGLIPALYMQVACMYDPAHALTAHMSPALILGAGCAALAWGLTKRKKR
jgi:hypothetical protein